MTSRAEVFELVRKYLPQQPLTGRGITLNYLKERLKSLGLDKKIPHEDPTTIIERLSPLVQSMILAYIPLDRLPEEVVMLKHAPELRYYLLQRFLKNISIPYPDPAVDLEVFRNKFHIVYRTFTLYDDLINESLEPYLPYIDWAANQLRIQGKLTIKNSPDDLQTNLGDALTHAIISNYRNLYDILIKYAPEAYLVANKDHLVYKALMQAARLYGMLRRDPNERFHDNYKKQIHDSFVYAEDLLSRGVKAAKNKKSYSEYVGYERLLEALNLSGEFPLVRQFIEQ